MKLEINKIYMVLLVTYIFVIFNKTGAIISGVHIMGIFYLFSLIKKQEIRKKQIEFIGLILLLLWWFLVTKTGINSKGGLEWYNGIMIKYMVLPIILSSFSISWKNLKIVLIGIGISLIPYLKFYVLNINKYRFGDGLASQNLSVIVCGISILSLLYLLWGEIGIKLKVFYGILFSFSTILLVVSQVRGVWIAYIPIIIILLAIKNLKVVISMFVLIGILFSISPQFRDNSFIKRFESVKEVKKNSSNRLRIEMWKITPMILKANPVKGIGIKSYQTYINKDKEFLKKEEELKKEKNLRLVNDIEILKKIGVHSHNTYLEILVSTGIIGFLLYFYVLSNFINKIYQKYKNTKARNEKIFFIFYFLFTLELLIYMLTEHILVQEVNMQIYWLIMAILLNYSVAEKKNIMIWKKYKIYLEKESNNLLELSKKIISNEYKIFKEFKLTKRNYVVGIEENLKKYVLKSPRNEHRIPQRKFLTLLKKGEALATLENITKLIEKYKFKEFVKPLAAIVKRKKGMIVESYLIMEYEKGKNIEKENIYLIVDFLKKLHKLKYYHGDANTSNFMIKNGELKVIDTQGKKYLFGEYQKYYEVFTFSEDLLVLECGFDGVELFNYPKNIWYYLAYFIKYGKRNKYIEKIKKWKKKKRDQGWKI